MQYNNINIRMSAELVRQIDRACDVETKRTGYTINRSLFVRRALEKALEAGAAEKVVKKSAKREAK